MTRLSPLRNRVWIGWAILAMVAAAACGGDSDRDATSTTTLKPATTSSTAADAAAGGGSRSTLAGVGGTTTTAAGAGVTTTTAAGAGVTTTTRSPTSSTRTKPGGAQAAGTRPGRYRYASTRTFSAGLTGEQRSSGESVLTVDPPRGADQHSVRVGDTRSSEQVLRFQPDGTYLVMLKVTEQGITKEFRPPAPVLGFPYNAAPGRTWSWRVTSVDGKTTVESSFRVERSEPVQVGTESVPAVVVAVTLVTSGDLNSRGTQTLWVSESRRLVIREQSVMDGTFGSIPFHSTADERLLSINPS